MTFHYLRSSAVNMPGPKWKPRPIPPEERAFLDRLKAAGIDVTPSTVGPDYRLPEPIDLDGVSLSDAIIEMRREG